MKRHLQPGLVYLALAVLMTWPLAATMGIALPAGGDNRHLAWVLAWVGHAIVSEPLRLFDGNIFHPASHAVAFSDPNVTSALLLAPAWWASGNPALLVNLLLLGSFVLCGLTAHALIRSWTGSERAAFAAGILFAFSPMRFSHFDHVQLYAFWWTPLAMLGLDRFLVTGGRLPLAAMVFALALQAYASIYLFVFAATAMVLQLLVAAVCGRIHTAPRRLVIGLVGGAALFALLCAPLLGSFLAVRLTWATARTLEQNVRYSASPLAYVSAIPGNVLWAQALERFADPVAPWEKYLFPGVAVLGLAAVGVVRVHGSFIVRLGLTLAAVGFVCSLGPYLRWQGENTGWPLPYLAAFHWIPPLAALRTPARFGLLASLGLALCASAGAARLSRVAWIGLLALALLEARVSPMPLERAPSVANAPPVYGFLAGGGEGAVIELPLARTDAERRELESRRIYWSTLHWRRVANGYSGYTPPTYQTLVELLSREPPEHVAPVLASWGIRTVVLHLDEMGEGEVAAWDALSETLDAEEIYSDRKARVLVLATAPSRFEPRRATLADAVLRPGARQPLGLVLEEPDLPLAVPPAFLGWHVGRGRWTSDDGSTTEGRVKYSCPPAFYRGQPPLVLFVDPPAREGRYELEATTPCFSASGAVVVRDAGTLAQEERPAA